MQTIKIGDKVNWCGTWGKDPAKVVTVASIEWYEKADFTGGIPIPKEEILLPAKDWCTFSFVENDHWAYGHQIDLLN